jgi:hypothetical protein
MTINERKLEDITVEDLETLKKHCKIFFKGIGQKFNDDISPDEFHKLENQFTKSTMEFLYPGSLKASVMDLIALSKEK